MRRILSILAASLALLLVGVHGDAQDKTLIVRPIADAPSFAKRALVIGVGQYEHAASLAPYTYNDARRFADLLRTQFKFPDEAITLLTDTPGTPESQRPTFIHLLNAIETLLNGVNEKSEVIVYFTGHGIRAEDHDWLVPLDGLPSKVSSTCLNYDEFKSRLSTKTPARALLIVDACRNLAGGKDASSSGFGAGKALAGAQFAELLSCQPKETSQLGKGGDFPESVFTHYLLAGLGGDAEAQENGVVTFDSLKEYVQGKVSQYVSKRYGESQNPDGRASLGRMVLAKPQRQVLNPAVVPVKQDPIPPGTNPEHPEIRPLPQRQPVSGGTKVNPKDGAELVYVPGGEFTMGDTDQKDNPPHKVMLSGYYLYKNLVTVAQYKKFCSATGQKMPAAPSWGWKDDHPIVNVSWNDAQAYCKWAGVRLPTEAEWEKAARGTDGRKYPWGNEFNNNNLWCTCSLYGARTNPAPVGSFPSGASPFGALDMVGNVIQWCADWYDADYTKIPNLANPTGPDLGMSRALRGGSWIEVFRDIERVSFRFKGNPAANNITIGFRCASQD